MDRDETEYLKRRMAYERDRAGTPPGFPVFPLIPGGRYLSEDFAALERTHVFGKSWLLAGHLDELPEPGSYKSWDRTGWPVVLIHQDDGAVKAFHNVCRHRGAVVARKDKGRTRLLACSYHGWSYDWAGNLVSVREERDFPGLDKSCLGLKPVRCERLGKFIYINFDDEARPLKDVLGPLVSDWAEFQLDRLRLIDHYEWSIPCNWKLALEGNIEFYHAPSIHQKTTPPFIHTKQGSITLFEGGHSRDVIYCEGKQEALEASGMMDALPQIDTVGEIARHHGLIYNAFPNGLYGDMNQFYVTAPQFWPDGLEATKYEVYWLGADWGDGPRPAAWDAVIEGFNAVIREDVEFAQTVQQGANSPAFDGIRPGYLEARIYHFHQALDAAIGRDNIPGGLAVEPVISADWIHPHDRQWREEAMAAASAAQ